MRIAANGLEFDVRTGGPEGGTPVLLLHGFPQHGGMWDLVTPALHAAGLRTYAPDLRGYSPGARPEGGYPMADCVADAVALLDALEVERAHVVGHDWGAVIGWHLAAMPDRARSLTAVSVPHPAAWAQARRADPAEKERTSYMRLFAQPGRAEEVLLAEDARRLRALFDPVDPARREEYVRPLLEPGALTGALNWYRALGGPLPGPARVPATLVWGEEDLAIGPASARGCAAHIADGVDYRFVPLNGLGHWVPDLAPEVVTAEILARAAGGDTSSGS
jgi:pimeloyl-ACP methyl ester carboxylesterase